MKVKIMPTKKQVRPRDAKATRDAILLAALTLFSRKGYDGVGMREIAEMVGCAVVLINRYFGSKEELFAAAVELAFADNNMFLGDVAALPVRLTASIMMKTDPEAEPIDPLMLMLRSAPNSRAAEILRDAITRRFELPLRSLLNGRLAAERAALILALCAGVLLMRKVIGTKALNVTSRRVLSAQIQSLFEALTQLIEVRAT
jgi:AcrR family transcriptional regulator